MSNINNDYSQLVKIYMEYGKYDEIKKLIGKVSNDEKRNDVLVVVSELIDEYIKEKNYAKVEEIAINFPNNEIIQSQLIKIYRKQGKLVEAEKIAKMYPDYEPVQSQLIKLYIEQRKYDKAVQIAMNFPNNEIIRSQLITAYIKQGKYDEVIEMAINFPNNMIIKSQLITAYMKQGKYDEAIELAKKNPSYEPIQSQLITIYMRKGRFDEATEIATKFPNYESIQGQLITIYMIKERFAEAIEIAIRFPNNEIIQSQLITAYIKQKKYNKAIEIAIKFPNNEIVQSQLITAYMKQGNYDKVTEIAKRYPNYETIQSQLITAYIRQGNYDKAIEIAVKFPNNEIIQIQLIKLYMRQGDYRKMEEIALDFPNNEVIQKQINILLNIPNFNEDNIDLKEFPDEIKNIRSRLSLGETSYNDIEVLDRNKDKINSKYYELIKLAIYDRLGNKKQGIEDLKKNSFLDINIKKSLISHLQKNKTFFDLEKWDSLIGWSSSIEKYQKTQKEELIEKQNHEENQESDSIKKVVPDISSVSHNIKKVSNAKVNETKNNLVQVVPKNTSNKHFKNKSACKKAKGSSTKKDTIYGVLNNNYKEKVFELKVKYYIDMHELDKRDSTIYKYDRLEELLASKPSQNNMELLLLMLVGDINVNVEDKYPKEYSKVLQRINNKKIEYRNRKNN